MYIKQLSVFVENKLGRASAILDILGENNINIRALSIAEASEFGILRMIVDNPEKAKTLLRESGVTVKTTHVLAAPIDDTPGGLSKLLNLLKENGVMVEYLYAFVARESEHAQVVLRVDDTDTAEKVLASLK